MWWPSTRPFRLLHRWRASTRGCSVRVSSAGSSSSVHAARTTCGTTGNRTASQGSRPPVQVQVQVQVRVGGEACPQTCAARTGASVGGAHRNIHAWIEEKAAAVGLGEDLVGEVVREAVDHLHPLPPEAGEEGSGAAELAAVCGGAAVLFAHDVCRPQPHRQRLPALWRRRSPRRNRQ